MRCVISWSLQHSMHCSELAIGGDGDRLAVLSDLGVLRVAADGAAIEEYQYRVFSALCVRGWAVLFGERMMSFCRPCIGLGDSV